MSHGFSSRHSPEGGARTTPNVIKLIPGNLRLSAGVTHLYHAPADSGAETLLKHLRGLADQ
jgi:hypothetical protein